MTPVERDDFLFALRSTLNFYGKPLEDEQQARFWLHCVSDYDANALKRALADHAKRSRYAPKPADLIKCIEEQRQFGAQHRPALPATDQPTTQCDPTVEKAWRYWIPRMHAMQVQLPGSNCEPADEAEAEEWLQIINRQVKDSAFNPEDPDKLFALPAAFRLQEIWGTP